MEPQFRKYLILLLVLALVAASAGFGMFIYYNGWSAIGINPKAEDTINTPETNIPSSTQTPLDTLSAPDQLKFLISNNSKIEVPEISNKSQVSLSDLPADISTLINTVQASSVQSVVYTTNASGFEVEFVLPQNSVEAYRTFLSSARRNSWEVKLGTYSAKAALVDLENEIYQIEVGFTQAAEQQTQAKVMVIKK